MQVDIFNLLYPTYKITKPIRLIELFAGYGSQALALKYLGVEFEHYRVVEFDKYAIQSYNEIHGTNFQVSDITETSAEDLKIVDTNKYEYIMTYSFPCQDLSLAGKRKGMSDTSTRSGLLWEVERILDECEELPQILLMENVPQVIGKDNVEHFNKWVSKLEELGYKNYHQNLIATDYGIPQTRNRTFMISILGNYNYNFPKTIPLKLKLKDMLEENVDEKYYLSDKFLNYCTDMTDRNGFVRGERFNPINPEINDKAYTVTTGAGNRPTDNFIIDNLTKDTENYIEWKEKGKLDIDCRAFKEDKVMSTIMTTPKNKVVLKIPEATKQGYAIAHEGDGVYINRPHQKRGVVQKGKMQTLKTSLDVGVVVGTYQHSKSDNFMKGKDRLQLGKEVSDTLQTTPKEGVVLKTKLCNELIEKGLVKENDIIRHSYSNSRLDEWESRGVELNNMSPTLDTGCDCLGVVTKEEVNLRIRKLTPKECFRLMGVKDEDYEKLTCSNAQKYKQAGNSIVVNVLMAIFKELIK